MRGLSWVSGLLRRAPLALLGPALAISIAVAFTLSLGGFIGQSRAALTVRAAATVPIDWQVQTTAFADPGQVQRRAETLADVRTVRAVSRTAVPGLSSTSSAGIRETGRAQIVALPDDYGAQFPGALRPLLGRSRGVLLLQQTAANLAANVGSTVDVRRSDGRVVPLRVDGVVDMPIADTFFQVVGAPANAGPAAPPDNVVIVPPDRFPALAAGSTVIRQVHVAFDHARLPHDPATAATHVSRQANAFQADLAGAALVGDNLSASLGASREDALYALLLVLLLGVPGLVLAGATTALVTSLALPRRRRHVALLQIRGASRSVLFRLVGLETLIVAGIAWAVGLSGGALASRWALPGSPRSAPGWTVAALLVGAVLAVGSGAAVLRSALSPVPFGSVRADVVDVPTERDPWPLRFGLDVLLLGGGAVVFWLTARSGYQVVVAPEGLSRTQVNYAALLAPALVWPGVALLTWRLTTSVLRRRTGRLARAVPGRAPELEAAVIRRRRQVIARGATGLAVAIGLAASTAVFTTTYDAQSRLDVALTVGSDVAVTVPPGASTTLAPASLAGQPGVTAVEPIQHRFAYVGPDLQDLFGVNPRTLARVAPLQDSFVPGSTVSTVLHDLTSTPDGVLLSAETLADYQLHPGDPIRIRLGTGAAQRLVTFRVLGQIREFPTAPKDSFIVANSDYVAASTGDRSVSTFLLKSNTPGRTADAIRRADPLVQVADVSSARSTVTTASGLAASDLHGLARLELAFGLILAVASAVLALLLGIAQRRRALVLVSALGATPRQRRRFLRAEARAVLIAGLIGGGAAGAVIAFLLVKVLNGIFDPPPTAPSMPWGYLAVLLLATVLPVVVVVTGSGRVRPRPGLADLREG